MQSVVHFSGTSTLHDFSGLATSKVARVKWTPAEQSIFLSAEAIEFNVASMTTHHKKRDKNMMKMFQPAEYPLITGSLKNWELGNSQKNEAVLLLKIQKKMLEIPVTLSAVTQDKEGLHFSSEFTISLKAFGLKRPSALGVIRVGDEVRLKVDTTVRKPEVLL